MTMIYVLVANDGSTNETVSEEEAKNWRVSMGGVITAYDRTCRVDNDPVPQIYDTVEEGAARVEELRALYSVIPINTMVSPQPDGLND